MTKNNWFAKNKLHHIRVNIIKHIQCWNKLFTVHLGNFQPTATWVFSQRTRKHHYNPSDCWVGCHNLLNCCHLLIQPGTACLINSHITTHLLCHHWMMWNAFYRRLNHISWLEITRCTQLSMQREIPVTVNLSYKRLNWKSRKLTSGKQVNKTIINQK